MNRSRISIVRISIYLVTVQRRRYRHDTLQARMNVFEREHEIRQGVMWRNSTLNCKWIRSGDMYTWVVYIIENWYQTSSIMRNNIYGFRMHESQPLFIGRRIPLIRRGIRNVQCAIQNLKNESVLGSTLTSTILFTFKIISNSTTTRA